MEYYILIFAVIVSICAIYFENRSNKKEKIMKYKVVLSPYKSSCPILKIDDGKPVINPKDTVYYQIHVISMDEIEYPSDWGYSIIYHHTLPSTSGAGLEKMKDLYDHGWRRIIASTDHHINNGHWQIVPILKKEFINYYCEVGGIDEIDTEELDKWIDKSNIENEVKNKYHNNAHHSFMRRKPAAFEDGIDLNSLAITIALKHELNSFSYWLRMIDNGNKLFDPTFKYTTNEYKSIGFSPYEELGKGTDPDILINKWIETRGEDI